MWLTRKERSETKKQGQEGTFSPINHCFALADDSEFCTVLNISLEWSQRERANKTEHESIAHDEDTHQSSGPNPAYIFVH